MSPASGMGRSEVETCLVNLYIYLYIYIYSRTSIIRVSVIRGTRLSVVFEAKIWYAQLI